MQPPYRVLAAALLFSLVTVSAPAADTDAEADRIALAVEALTRLEGLNLETNPSMKERVLKVLERTRGTPSFLRLVQHFQLKDQNAGLLDLALAQPSGESGVEATRMLLSGGAGPLLRQTLEGTNTIAAARLAEALGNSGRKDAIPYLEPLPANTRRDGAVRRQAVRALAKTREGAQALLGLARTDRLGDDLKFAAGSALQAARWPEIQAEAAKVLPLPPAQNAASLPPISELARRSGDVANGARVFARSSPGCISCHIVRGQGTELGPNLSEIGSKLGKDALYEAILDPNAGVSFGFEAWNVTLKNGDEVYGLIASETADELTLKAVGGIATRLPKSEITARVASKLSLMPVGLQQGMTAQELVDLVEYLASLKKP